MDDLPVLLAPDASPPQPAVLTGEMSYEDALRERVRQFVWTVLQAHAPDARLREDARLVHDVGLTELDLLDVLKAVNEPPLDAAAMAGTCGAFCDAVVAAMERRRPQTISAYRLSPAQPPRGAGTIWHAEWTGHLGASGFGWECGYSTKDDQDFARLRRLWREHHEGFTAYWRTLDLRQMRLVLFRAAPLTLDDTDELLPVARLLLPEVNVSLLMAAQLLDIFKRRTQVKYKQLVDSELKRAKALADHFPCPVELEGKWMDMERRQLVPMRSSASGLPETRCVEGRVFALYCASMGSMHALLLALLNNWMADRVAVVRRVVEQVVASTAVPRGCHVCGRAAAKLLQCSKCKQRRFCSRECQTADWPSHKRQCAAPAFALKFDE